MGVVSNILEALRRIGSPTQRSALRRFDAGLEGKQVLAQEQVNIRDPLGSAQAFVATAAPWPETVAVLTEEEVRPIKENAQFGVGFLRAFAIPNPDRWTLEDLDAAFTAWQRASDQLGFSNEYVIEVLGAMFGEYCAANLDMRWITVTDHDGTALAVDGVKKEFRGFPHSSVSKRIKDSECGFFRPIFLLLKQEAAEANQREHSA
jgi:hypothetical protein